MLKNKLFYFVVFAAAAIFAVTLVGCDSGSTAGDTINNLNVPANVATYDLLKDLFVANDTIIIVDPVDAADEVALTDDLIIPLGKTLNLNGHPLSVASAKVLVVAGELTGLTKATADGGQLTVTGNIIAKSAALTASYAGYATGATGTNVKAMSVPGTASSDTTAQKYFFGDITVAADAANVVQVFGSVKLPVTEALDLSAATIEKISGNFEVTVASTVTAESAVAITIGSVDVKGNVSISGNGYLVLGNSGALKIGGEYSAAPGVKIKAGSITNDNSSGALDFSAAYVKAVTGEAPVNAKLFVKNVTLVGAIIENVIIADAASTTKYSLNVKKFEGQVSGVATGDVLNLAGNGEIEKANAVSSILNVMSGTLKVAAGGVIALADVTSAGILNVRGTLDLSAEGAKVTLAAASSGCATVNIWAAAAGSGAIKFGADTTHAIAKNTADTTRTVEAAVAGESGTDTVFTFTGTTVTDITTIGTTAAALTGELRAYESTPTTDYGSIILKAVASKVGVISAATKFATAN